jgi:uncharacterized membrane protein YczE
MPLTPLPEDRRPSRLLRLVGGLFLCGTGIAAMILSGLGLSPWDVLHQGIAIHTGLAVGTVTIMLGVVVLMVWIPLRERPGMGTVVNAVLVGLVVNAWLARFAPPDDTTLRIILMLAGTPLLALGVGLYIGAGLGPGPRDGLMTGMARRGHPVWMVRGGIELTALAGGWLLGGTVGVGTVVSVAAIGPLVHLSVDRFGRWDHRADATVVTPHPGEDVATPTPCH